MNFKAPVVLSGAFKFCVRHDRAITQQFWVSGIYAFSQARPLPETDAAIAFRFLRHAPLLS
jgi:hypothetical protein